MKTQVRLAALLLMFSLPSLAIGQSDTSNVDSYIESLRADLRADKVDIITQAMQFSDKDAKLFWPVYHRYENGLRQVNNQRVTLIKSYADKFPNVTDADAKVMIDEALDYYSRRDDLRKKYAEEFLKAGLPALTAAKFLQLEHRLDIIVDLELASQLPSLLTQPVAKAGSHK